jgi:hypothetical protein
MRLGLVIGSMCAIIASGCKEPEPPAGATDRFQIFVRVESDPGQKVAGATVTRGGKLLGTTGPDGRAMLTLNGVEGETMDVTVKCPETFASPPKPSTVKLARFADKTKVPEYSVACPPLLRRVVIAVRAENGPNLPVVYLNRPGTRTDSAGAAHFVLEVAPGAQFQVTLDTSESSRLRPANPFRPFTAPAHDEILVFDQKFEMDRQKPGGPRTNVPRAVN